MIKRITTFIRIPVCTPDNYFSAMYFGRGATWARKGVGLGAASVTDKSRGEIRLIPNPIKKGTRKTRVETPRRANPSRQWIFRAGGAVGGGGGDRSSLSGQTSRHRQLLQGARETPSSTLVNYPRNFRLARRTSKCSGRYSRASSCSGSRLVRWFPFPEVPDNSRSE
jgi:hypothetical protein